MKKVILSFSILLGFLVSCEKNDVTQETNLSSESNSTIAQKQSTIITGVESMYINNGLGSTGCANNILIFPTWNSYWATIDQLDQLTENYCNSFDATVPLNITDDQYDVLCTNAGFDEDNMLLKFENDLEFCSLRQKIQTAEDIWLNSLPATGTWDANADPDNDFIDDITERALLSIGHEVIIGDKKRGYVIYKFTNDDGGFIQINNMDLAALQQINQGVIPTNNPNVIVNTPRKDDAPSECKYKVKEVSYEENGDNKIKRISKIRRENGVSYASTGNQSTSIFKSKIKAKTKGYKRKNNKWKAKRTWITAGIDGVVPSSNGVGFDTCSTQVSINNVKEKRRRHVKVKETIDTFVGVLPALHYFTVKDNFLYSLHKQAQTLIINRDFYDMPVN